jgi:uncharacterized protein YdaU (DUF1376 family)
MVKTAKHSFKAPAFQLYVKEFLQDEAVIAMDLEAVGAYIVLLCHQWNEGSVPADVSLLAKICRTLPEKMQTIWPQVASKFSPLLGKKNRLVNPKLEIVRKEKVWFSQKQAEFGKYGAQKKQLPKSAQANGVERLSSPGPKASREATQKGKDSSGPGIGSVDITPPTPSKEGVNDCSAFNLGSDIVSVAVNGNRHHSPTQSGRIRSEIQRVAREIYQRHPNGCANYPNARGRRNLSEDKVQGALQKILKYKHVPQQEHEAFLERINRNHAAMCADGLRDGGQYVCSLKNYMAVTEERYEIERPDPVKASNELPRLIL